MKRKIVITGIVTILLAGVAYYLKDDTRVEGCNYDGSTIRLIVPDQETAIELAEVFFKRAYGEGVVSHKPYHAVLKDTVWIVTGAVYYESGGAPVVEIRASDGGVMRIFHGK